MVSKAACRLWTGHRDDVSDENWREGQQLGSPSADTLVRADVGGTQRDLQRRSGAMQTTSATLVDADYPRVYVRPRLDVRVLYGCTALGLVCSPSWPRCPGLKVRVSIWPQRRLARFEWCVIPAERAGTRCLTRSEPSGIWALASPDAATCDLGAQEYRPCDAPPDAETGNLGVRKYRPCDAPPDAGSCNLGVQKYRPCDELTNAETAIRAC